MNLTLFLPELALLLTAALFLCLACLPLSPKKHYYWAVAVAGIVVVVSIISIRFTGDMFQHTYRIDLFSQVFKALLAIGFFLVIVLCDEHTGIARRHYSEACLLLALSTLAMMLMASGIHLLVLFLSLELSSYSLYILVSLRRAPASGMISGLRFFLIGACVSAVMLLGMALLYSSAGSLSLDRLMHDLPSLVQEPIVGVGLLLATAGFLFKLAFFPFHLWAPDTYEGAPNQVTAFIATVSKLAAVAVLLRLTSLTHGAGDLPLKALIALAVISMTAGNLAAIAQKDFKRLMAFSSIAHAGYLMIGIICLTKEGVAATMFYGVAVLALKFTSFMVMIEVAADGRNLQISEFAGLHKRAPLLAMALMISLFGLAGIPPTIGFTGKFLIFTAAVQQGYLALVVIAMVNVVISLYYYLMVLKSAYLDEPLQPLADVVIAYPIKVMALLLIMAIIAFGFFPNILLELMRSAAFQLP